MKLIGGVVIGCLLVGVCAVVAAMFGVSVADAAVSSGYVADIHQQQIQRMQATLARSERATIGHSVNGRAIVAKCYGDLAAPRRAAVIGQLHGSEPAGIGVAKRVEKSGAPAGVRMCVVRTFNPDGSAARTRVNAHKVDINRNSPGQWSAVSKGPEYNPGPGPASEPETKAYVEFLTALDPNVVLSYHQAANGVDSYGAKNMALVKGLGQRMGLRVVSFDCSGVCNGTLTGWFNSTHQGSAVTLELPRSSKVTKAKVARYAAAAQWAMQNG